MRKLILASLMLAFASTSFAQQTGSVSCVSAASFNTQIAKGQIATCFLSNAIRNIFPTQAPSNIQSLPTDMQGVVVLVNNIRAGQFYVSGSQLNLLLPANLPNSEVSLIVLYNEGTSMYGTFRFTPVDSCGDVFTAQANGKGYPAAVVALVNNRGEIYGYQPVMEFVNGQPKAVPLPIFATNDPQGRSAYLIIFGSGWYEGGAFQDNVNLYALRRFSDSAAVGTVTFAGRAPFFGGNQANILLPRGRGLLPQNTDIEFFFHNQRNSTSRQTIKLQFAEN